MMSKPVFPQKFSTPCPGKVSAIVTGLLALSMNTMETFAQETFAQRRPLEEIIVTAQKREQSLQDVGIAITAFTAEELKKFNFVNNTEVAAFTPGVYISASDGGTSQQFTIRGATQNELSMIAEATNAVYVDGVYQFAQQTQMLASFDMERLEILKGPQGTLFGRNATGGLIHNITKKPTREFEAYADVSYGRFDSLRVEGAVSGPITDTLSARVSAFRDRHDPIYKNIFTEDDLPPTPAFLAAQGRGPLTVTPGKQDDLFIDDQWAVRTQLQFEPNEDVTFRFKADYARSEPGTGYSKFVPTVALVDDTDGDGVENQVVDTAFAKDVLSPGFQCEKISVNTGNCVDSALDLDFDGLRPCAQCDFFGASDPNPNALTFNASFADENAALIKTYSFSGELTWDLGFGELTAISSYADHTRLRQIDTDEGPAPQFTLARRAEVEWFTQEVRLAGETERARWIAGFYFLHGDSAATGGIADQVGGINPFGGLFFNGFVSTANDFLEATADATLETDSYSLFGQVDYDLTEKFTFSLGFRGIIEEKDFSYTNRLFPNTNDSRTESTLFAGAAPLTVPGTDIPVEFLPPFADETSDFLWSGKVQLDYHYSNDVLFYASVNRGVKAGSFNVPLLTVLSEEDYPYDEEVLKAYEIGLKSTFLDGRARFNASAYYYDYDDYQAFQFVGVSGAVFNADATYKGLEAELSTSPVDNLDFVFGVSYIDPEVEDLLVAPNTPRDVEPTFTPEVQFNGMGRYTLPNLLFGGSVSVQLDGNYASSAFLNINNFGTHKMDGYWVGNARVRWVSADGRLELGGFVNNFTDTRYQLLGFELSATSGSDSRVFGKPRWWGINLRYNYF